MSLKEFQVIQKLGEGAYSSVFKVKRHSDGQEYALKKVKLMNLSEKEKQNALNEVRILASIRSNNIAGYKEAFLDEQSNSLCIIMEYANHGDLFQKIVEHQKKGQLFPEQEIWNIFIQMVRGIKSLHDLKIFHRDLKSANIFLNKDGTAKLGDMNVSKVAKKGLLYTQTGTPYYASPEVWKDQPYDAKSDIWSLGCVLYEMTTLKPPFRAEDMEGLYKKVIRGYYPRIPPHFSSDLANVIRALLQVAPHLRPSADKILQLPAIVKRVNDQHLLEADEENPTLLTTIRVPKNLHYLTDKLPKANYAPLKIRKVDKYRFLQTLEGYKGERGGSAVQQDDDQQSLASAPQSQQQQQQQTDSVHSQSQLHLPKLSSKQAGKLPQIVNANSHNSSVLLAPNRNASAHNKENIVESNNNLSLLDQSVIKKKKKRPEFDSNLSAISSNQNSSQVASVQQSGAGAAQQVKNQESKKKALELLLDKKLEEAPNSKQYYEMILGNNSNPHPKLGSKNSGHVGSQQIMHSQKKAQDNYDFLDIEGESKPLLKKKLKNSLHHSPGKNDDSPQQSRNAGEDASSRLPQIGGPSKLPKIISMLPSIQSPFSNADSKESQKIREIQKAYRVNINQLDDPRDRQRSVKRVDINQKNKQYPLTGKQSSSLPPP